MPSEMRLVSPQGKTISCPIRWLKDAFLKHDWLGKEVMSTFSVPDLYWCKKVPLVIQEVTLQSSHWIGNCFALSRRKAFFIPKREIAMKTYIGQWLVYKCHKQAGQTLCYLGLGWELFKCLHITTVEYSSTSSSSTTRFEKKKMLKIC